MKALVTIAGSAVIVAVLYFFLGDSGACVGFLFSLGLAWAVVQ